MSVSGAGSTVVARLDAQSKAETGGTVEIALDATQIKLFDPDGGRAIS